MPASLHFKIRPKTVTNPISDYGINTTASFLLREGHLCAQLSLNKMADLIIKTANTIEIVKDSDTEYTIYLNDANV